jgi:outer membrane murein-binding lipoprotein Lpp
LPTRPALTLAVIVLIAVAVSALVAYCIAVRPVQIDQRLTDLEQHMQDMEQQVDQLHTDVSLLRE